MKLLRSSIFRAVCSIAVGVLLLRYPDEALTWLTILIGVLFILPGLLAVLTYVVESRQAGKETVVDTDGKVLRGATPVFPFAGIGSIALGLLLALMPGTFEQFLTYVIAGILILGSISQIVTIVKMRRLSDVSFSYFLIPMLLFVAGLAMILKQEWLDNIPFVDNKLWIPGICCMVYGAWELVCSLRYYFAAREARKREEAQFDEAQEITPGPGDIVKGDGNAAGTDTPSEGSADTENKPEETASSDDSTPSDASSSDDNASSDGRSSEGDSPIAPPPPPESASEKSPDHIVFNDSESSSVEYENEEE